MPDDFEYLPFGDDPPEPNAPAVPKAKFNIPPLIKKKYIDGINWPGAQGVLNKYQFIDGLLHHVPENGAPVPMNPAQPQQVLGNGDHYVFVQPDDEHVVQIQHEPDGPEDEEPEELDYQGPKHGPQLVASKLDKLTGLRSCSTCGYQYTEDRFKKSADGFYICGRCMRVFGQCSYCGWTPPPEKWIVKVFIHTYCADCAPQRKTKLNIKQRLEFAPKRDVLSARKDKVWPRQST